MVWKTLSSMAFAMVLMSTAHSQSLLMPLAQQAMGVWADENGDSNIEIVQCGATLCGRVVWLKRPNDDAGRPITDIKNPDKALRSRPVLGLTIIAGLKFDSGKSSLKGKVYNADDGKMYDLFLRPKGQTMRVEGCLFRVLCDTQTWTRVR